MQIYWNAIIEVDKASEPAYEWALGEYATDADGEPTHDDDGRRIPINPISFPLPHVQITWNGRRATIQVARPGRAAFLLDRLVNVAEPQKQQVRGAKRGSEIVTLTGQSERLVRQGIQPDDAVVVVRIIEWSADKVSNLTAS